MKSWQVLGTCQGRRAQPAPADAVPITPPAEAAEHLQGCGAAAAGCEERRLGERRRLPENSRERRAADNTSS